MRRAFGILLAVAATLCVPPAALADAPTTTTTTAPPPTTTPGPPPAQANVALYLSHAFTVHHELVTVSGREVTVTGVVRPYVPGERVVLKAFLSGRRFRTAVLRLKPSTRRVYGGFTLPLRAPGAGTVSVVVEHTADAALGGFEHRASFAVLAPHVAAGATGRLVQLIQQRLAALHFYIPQTGVYDHGTELAVDAYHRLLGWGTSPLLGPAALHALLDGTGAFHVRFPGQGRHAEGDLTHQLLALIVGSQVQWIFPISSGKPSTPTILGSYRIYQRTPGLLPDGMYYSDFFIRGYAIHGYDPAPDYPASHGCMRLPMVDAIPAFDWLALGDWVDSYLR